MNQHQVQKAYLNNFSVNNKVWIHSKTNENACLRRTDKITTLKDFQSEDLETYQANHIESPGINALRKLINNNELSEADINIIMTWSALHCIRIEKFRQQPEIKYNTQFKELMGIEEAFADYYRYCFVYTCNLDEFLITSDKPIIEFTVEENILRVITLSPKKMVLFSPIDDLPVHEKIKFPDMINAMHWASALNYVFSNQKALPIPLFKSIIESWNLVPQFEKNTFAVREQIVS